MSWPHDNDYVEALQNAGHAFEDPELRAGTVELTTLGMPRPRAGNFAIVFKVSSAGRDWAIKCFKKSDFERHERYRAIADHLARVNVPALCRFQYLERGVRVGGTWYLRIERQIAAGFEKMSHQQRLDKERLTRDRASLMDEWQASLIKLAHHADGQMADIRTGLLTVDKEEQAALDALVQQERAEAVALHDRHGRQINELEAQIRASTSNESRELTAANDVLRRQYVLNELMHRSIRVAEIPGLGPGLKQRLLNAGIWTAADVEETRVSDVEGIGPSRTAAILEWQAAIERAAEQRAPTLSPADRKRIADFHSAQRKGWESQVDQLRRALTSATTALRSKYQNARAAAQSTTSARRHALQNEIAKLEAAKNAQEQHLNADCSTRQATLDAQIKALEQAIAEALARAKRPWEEAIGVQRKTWSQLESEVQKRAKVIEQSLTSLRTTETELLWRLSKHEAEMESFRDVTARAYLRAVTRLKC